MRAKRPFHFPLLRSLWSLCVALRFTPPLHKFLLRIPRIPLQVKAAVHVFAQASCLSGAMFEFLTGKQILRWSSVSKAAQGCHLWCSKKQLLNNSMSTCCVFFFFSPLQMMLILKEQYAISKRQHGGRVVHPSALHCKNRVNCCLSLSLRCCHWTGIERWQGLSKRFAPHSLGTTGWKKKIPKSKIQAKKMLVSRWYVIKSYTSIFLNFIFANDILL